MTSSPSLDTLPPQAAAPLPSAPAWIEALIGGDDDGAPAEEQRPQHRGRRLALAALLLAALLSLWLQALAALPMLPLRVDAQGQLALAHDDLESGSATVRSLSRADGARLDVAEARWQGSPRWTPDPQARERLQQTQRWLADAAADGRPVTLLLSDGRQVERTFEPRGLGRLGAVSWVMAGLTLLMLASAGSLLIGQARGPARAFSAVAAAQALSLAASAAEWLPGLPGTAWPGSWPLAARWLPELLVLALVLHLALHFPQRSPRLRERLVLVWGAAAASLALLAWQATASVWWTVQILTSLGWLATAALMAGARQAGVSPLAAPLLRLALLATISHAGLGLLQAVGLSSEALRATLLGGASGGGAGLPLGWSLAWQVLCGLCVALIPLLAGSARNRSELALVLTLAAGAWLGGLGLSGLWVHAAGPITEGPLRPLLIALASLSSGAALTGALWWAALRWLPPLPLGNAPGAERMFDALYRAARTLETHPEDAGGPLSQLLAEVFQPRELLHSPTGALRIRIVGDGTTMIVPVPALVRNAPPGGSLVLRHLNQGRRLFSRDELRLCERIIEQLRRAVTHAHAVEQGRDEERIRIAQDLHDDIGARLLTLMYKAPDPEIEGYIRHTLQDLKTLTRGLAAGQHQLSHAAAEWKADVSQRLHITGCELRWHFSTDQDPTLSVVQWSAITRVLRELVNNVIAHAQASQVEVSLQLERGQLMLGVSDDGRGHDPQTWSHGLGLGGVRKRVKVLGGHVQWQERQGGGIRCEVRARLS
ncbi:MAG: hypothetical protein RLY78_1619 [Pseudomonadota bacterium]